MTEYSSTANRIAKMWVRNGKSIEVLPDKNYDGTAKTCNSTVQTYDGVEKTCEDLRTCKDEERAKVKGMKALYFRWLIDMLDKKMVKKYSSLLLHLFKDSFIESKFAPMDVHRARDGIGLRTRFIQENKFSDEQLEELKYDDCSWLEMLIALSIRIDDQLMFDMNLGNRTDKWFWLIIGQMDLDRFDENHYNYAKVKDKLNRFIRRDYENGGKNGIFKCNFDVRKVEIWYQMHSWFNENTPKIEF